MKKEKVRCGIREESTMSSSILKEEQYRVMMDQMVVPFLLERKAELWLEREQGKKLYVAKYSAECAKGIVLISHGFTETAEKYLECIYYFVEEGYHVYCIEHCGHGRSYRMTEDLSLVHVEKFERYTEDLLFAAKLAKQEQGELPLFLYGHSMGGGIGAAAAAMEPELFKKVILSSPMIRPLTGSVPWGAAQMIAAVFCLSGKGERYVAGQTPYSGPERFEESASTSRARFDYYQKKRNAEPLYQMSAASYGWLRSAGKLNRYLRTEGWKKIQSPVLLFQAEQDAFVSKKEQERFICKLNHRGYGRLVRVPGTKHEIFQAESSIQEGYWRKIFAFLGEKKESTASEKRRLARINERDRM